MNRVLTWCGLLGLVLLCGCGGSKEGETGSTGGVAEWKVFDPEHGKFSIEMPGMPEEQPGGTFYEKKWAVESAGVKYSIRYTGLLRPEGRTPAEWTENQMNNRLDTFLPESGARRIVEPDKPVRLGGQQGLEVAFELPDKSRSRLWVCVAGTRMYWLQIIGTKEQVNSVIVNRFPDSFKVGR